MAEQRLLSLQTLVWISPFLVPIFVSRVGLVVLIVADDHDCNGSYRNTMDDQNAKLLSVFDNSIP